MAFRGGLLVFLRAVSEESQVGNSSSRQDGVPGTDSIGSHLLWGGGDEGSSSVAKDTPQGQYRSLEDSTAAYSLLAAWSLDLLPSQVKQRYLP